VPAERGLLEPPRLSSASRRVPADRPAPALLRDPTDPDVLVSRRLHPLLVPGEALLAGAGTDERLVRVAEGRAATGGLTALDVFGGEAVEARVTGVGVLAGIAVIAGLSGGVENAGEGVPVREAEIVAGTVLEQRIATR
jgi:hypothetical protein